MKIKLVSLERLFCLRRNMPGQIPVPNACCLDLGAASIRVLLQRVGFALKQHADIELERYLRWNRLGNP